MKIELTSRKKRICLQGVATQIIPAVAVSNIDLQSSRRGLADGVISTEGREQDKLKSDRNYS
jgi:hypothetical protein